MAVCMWTLHYPHYGNLPTRGPYFVFSPWEIHVRIKHPTSSHSVINFFLLQSTTTILYVVIYLHLLAVFFGELRQDFAKFGEDLQRLLLVRGEFMIQLLPREKILRIRISE